MSKTRETRQVSFRTRVDVYEDYLNVAEARGVDLSALLNWVVVDYRPLLLLCHAQNNAAMLRAVAAGLPSHVGAGVGPDPRESLKLLTATIHTLQLVADRLSAQFGCGSSAAA